MPWTVEYDPEIGIVQGTYVGRVTADAFKEATIKAIGWLINKESSNTPNDDGG